MSKETEEEKELRKFALEIARNKKSSVKYIAKYYKSLDDFVKPDFAVLEVFFNAEDEADAKLKELYTLQDEAKKAKDSLKLKELTQEIKNAKEAKKNAQNSAKAEMDKHVQFSRAAKPYLDAEKLMKEKENYKHFDELAAKYDESKASAEAARQALIDEQKRLDEEKAAKTQQIKEEKERAKAEKKEKAMKK